MFDSVQRLANLALEAVDGTASVVSATSLMAVQSRTALDLLLAEKGGVCSMFGNVCFTLIRNNTAPDGSVTKALEGSRTLSHEMMEHSGVNDPLGGWWMRTWGRWKGIILAMISTIAIFCTVVCRCCCVPRIRSLCIRFITSMAEKGAGQPAGSMMPLVPVALPVDEPQGYESGGFM